MYLYVYKSHITIAPNYYICIRFCAPKSFDIIIYYFLNTTRYINKQDLYCRAEVPIWKFQLFLGHQ